MSAVAATLRRLGLITGASLCWYVATRLWDSSNMVIEPLPLALALMNYALAALMLLFAVVERPGRHVQWLLALALPLTFAGTLVIQKINQEQFGGPLITDVHLFSDYSATLVRMGQNPYRYDMLDSFRVYRASQRFATPKIDGDLVNQVSYPALAFLVYVPFQWLHVDTSLINPLFLFATLLLIFAIAPPALRFVALVPVFVNPNYLLYAFGGVNDVVWAFLLCLVVVLLPRRGQGGSILWSGLCFGLACAFKQQVWFVAPYLLIFLYHQVEPDRRLRLLARFIAIVAVVFLVFNLPFILDDFPAWLSGIFSPVSNAMIVLGQGLSSLTLFGVVMLPHGVYNLLTFGLMGLTIVLYARYFDHWREALWIFPALVLWFGYRSLNSYWYFYLLPLLCALIWTSRREWASILEPEPTRAQSRFRRQLWAGSVVAILLIAGIVGWFSRVTNPVELSLQLPIHYDGLNTRLVAQVTNHSDQPLTPRFSVQTWTDQPFFWDIVHGANVLRPGESDTYVLGTDVAQHLFDPTDGAQIIVNDADGYTLRASTRIAPVVSLAYPDAVPNGHYDFWNQETNAPYGWGLVSDLSSNRLQIIRDPDQGNSLQMVINQVSRPTRIEADTWLMLPESPIELWTRVPAGANRGPDFSTLYGVHLISTYNDSELLVLFGDEDGAGTLPARRPGEKALPYVMLRAPREAWSRQSLDLTALFERAHLPLPAPSFHVQRGLEIPAQMVNFRLFYQTQTASSAEFGPVNNLSLTPNTDQAIARTIASREMLLVWHGELNRKAGNFQAASTAYAQALAINPDNSAANIGEGLLALDQQDWSGALADFGKARDLNYQQSAIVYSGIGQAQMGLLDFVDAQQAFAKAVDLVGQPPAFYTSAEIAQMYRGLGLSLLAQKRFALAESILLRALKLDAWDSSLYTALQQSSIGQENCATAADYARQGQALNLNVQLLDCHGGS